ncbi:helix-turn-helix domain-containing protein [Rhizobium sp. G21]|uniref:helix-turn-helix domain-containing protein n=1 Tax=Rhizobium sp. G21 TaxID=2758439 RepID=UPI0016010217|nr:helix-turn-helix domain-containing protein [Rhizobium sp. G21]MBB1251191.1 helix-turn-helix domain-containing protein [Rhizobium sp. G21]
MSFEEGRATNVHQALKVANESLMARDAIPSREHVSSRDQGWSSLLVDVHSGVSSTESYSSVATPDLRIGVTLAGSFHCDTRLGGQWRQDHFTPGSTMLHRTIEKTNYRFPDRREQDFRLGLIYLPQQLLMAADEEFRRTGKLSETPAYRSVLVRDRAVSEVVHALVEAMDADGGDLYADATATWLAAHILRRYGMRSLSDDPRSPGHLTDSRLARVLEFMSENYDQPLTLDRLATEACISRFHFLRLFKEKTGHSPIKHLANIRFAAARRLLLSTDLPISEIARLSGFTSLSGLSKQFTIRFGVSPRQYRSLSTATSELL